MPVVLAKIERENRQKNQYSYRECPVCGANKYIYNEKKWAYRVFVKQKTYCFCSWKCLRIYERTQPSYFTDNYKLIQQKPDKKLYADYRKKVTQ